MAHKSTTTATSTGSADITFTWPTTAAHDRALIVVVSDVDSLTWTTPAGVTTLGSALSGTNDGQTMRAYEKKDCAGTEGGTTITFSTTGNAFDKRGVLILFTGRDNTAAVTFITPTSSGASSSASPISIGASSGTAATGDDVAAVYCLDKDANTQVWSMAPPGSYTEQADLDSTPQWQQIAAYTTDNVASGAIGTLTAVATRTTGTGNASWGVFVIAIPKAAGAAATSDPTESGASRHLRANAIYRMSPENQARAQKQLRAQKRAYGFAVHAG